MMPALTKRRSVSWPMLSALPAIDLARLPEQLDQPAAQQLEVADAEPVEPVLRPGRQRGLQVAEDARRVDRAALHLLHELGALADQRADDQRHRDDRDHDADEHAQERREVAARARSGARSCAAAAGRRWRGSPPRRPRRRRAAAARRRPPRPSRAAAGRPCVRAGSAPRRPPAARRRAPRSG